MSITNFFNRNANYSNIPVLENPEIRTIEELDKSPEDIEERLNIEHPYYTDNLKIWIPIRDFVIGGRAMTDRAREYLPPYLGEDPDAYRHRLSTFSYTPVLPKAVDTFVSKLSTGTLVCNSSSENVRQTIEAMEPMRFASDTMRFWLLYGVSVCTYDVNPGGVVVPHLIDPISLINWGDKPDGTLDFAVIKSTHVYSQKLQKPQVLIRWKLFDNETLTTYEKLGKESVKVVSKVPFTQRGCPVLRFCPPEEMWTASHAYLLQLKHVLLENTQLQAGMNLYVQRAYKPLQTPDSDLPETYFDSSAPIETSNKHLVIGDFAFTEARGTSVTTNAALLETIEKQIRTIIAMSPIDTESLVESGESKKYDHDELKSTLIHYGDYLRRWVTMVLDLVGNQWGRWKEDNAEVTGLDRFEVDNIDNILAHAGLIEQLGDNITPTAKMLFYLQVNNQIAGVQPRDIMQIIREEIVHQFGAKNNDGY